MIGGDVSLNVNVALNKPLLGAAAVLSQNLTNTLFATQLLQWNIILLTKFMNTELTKVFGCITRLRIKRDKNGIRGYAYRAHG